MNSLIMGCGEVCLNLVEFEEHPGLKRNLLSRANCSCLDSQYLEVVMYTMKCTCTTMCSGKIRDMYLSNIGQWSTSSSRLVDSLFEDN